MGSKRYGFVVFGLIVGMVGTLAARVGFEQCLGGAAAMPHNIEYETRSDFSHIRVKRQGNIRTLVFVRDNGEEAVETMLNLQRPHELLVPYTRVMFASYLFRPKQQRVALIGLGGGAMVHFLQHYTPQVQIDAVEIDPVVVEIAARYFHTKPNEKVRIITGDGLDYLEKTPHRYDVIYFDAFLKPSRNTDPTGMPLHLKTEKFYRGLREKLVPEGLVVINLNQHPALAADLKLLRSVFPQVHVFRAPPGNVVVVAAFVPQDVELPLLKGRAKELDQRFQASFSFQEILGKLAN